MRFHRHSFSFASSLPILSLALASSLLLIMGSTGCGSDRACFYWTEAEGACPTQEEAIDFFSSGQCSSDIASIDSEGTFEDDTCCYDVTESSSDFVDCFPTPVPPGPSTSVSVGVGGAGGIGGAGGSSGTAGNGGAGGDACAPCKQFLIETTPPELCPASAPIYEAFTDCKCFGKCSAECGDTCNASQVPSDACNNCLLDTVNGCGMEFLACSNDT